MNPLTRRSLDNPDGPVDATLAESPEGPCGAKFAEDLGDETNVGDETNSEDFNDAKNPWDVGDSSGAVRSDAV